MNDLPSFSIKDPIATQLTNEISASTDSPRVRELGRFGLAVIGARPWIGGFIAVAVELRKDPDRIDNLQRQWPEHHNTKLSQLQNTLTSIAKRLENFDGEVNEQLESPVFFALVDKGFREWDAVATEEKREYVRRKIRCVR